MTIFDAAKILRKHIEEKTANMNLVSATWDYAVDPYTGEIMKVRKEASFSGAYIFHVVFRYGNIDIEQA